MANRDRPTVVSHGAVVVGINGGLAGCRHALVFAAGEARLRNATIRLVHGCEPLSTLTERQPSIPLVARERQGRRQLRDAADALRPLLGRRIAVEFLIDPRTGIETLLAQSSSAELLVLQRRDLTAMGRISAGSTSSAVAARAGCPVAVIRTGQSSSHGRGAVLVGLDDSGDADTVLAFAFAEAAARGAPLTAIGGSAPEALDRWAAEFPGVVVDHLTGAAPGVEGLQEASASAELLVIGRRGPDRDQRNLGPTARRLIDTAHCPVLVVAPTSTGTGDLRHPVRSASASGQHSSASSPG